jgi:hypothetical protein
VSQSVGLFPQQGFQEFLERLLFPVDQSHGTAHHLAVSANEVRSGNPGNFINSLGIGVDNERGGRAISGFLLSHADATPRIKGEGEAETVSLKVNPLFFIRVKQVHREDFQASFPKFSVDPLQDGFLEGTRRAVDFPKV